MKRFIKKNIKLLIVLSVIILISAIGATLALTLRFGPTSISATTANVVVNVRYEKDGGNNDITSITSNGDMIPINLDTSNITNVINSTNVVKFKFWVSGNASNPNRSIYDISLNNITIDCELKNTYVKWVLYKNNQLLGNGNFSPTFDTMPNNRMLLTSTQQDLTTTEDEYLIALYIEDTCTNINNCQNPLDQSEFLNKNFSASIGIETATKSKKTNTRTTGEAIVCEKTGVAKPVCKEGPVYTGASQSLFREAIPNEVTVNQSTGIDAGEYTVTAKLDSGYKWSDGTTEDYVFTCRIYKRGLTIITQDQVQGAFVSSPAKVNTLNLVSGHTINSIQLSTITATDGNIITAGNAIIFDSNSNNVTSNYSVNYENVGKIVEE